VVISGSSVSSTNKPDHHDIAKILLKVATIRVGSYGNEIRELIFSGFEVAESCVCLFVCLFDGS
jgi:hypothetical protein